MTDTVVDLSACDLSFRHRRLVSASPELVRAWGEDLEELREDIAEHFGPEGSWCEVGGDLHTLTDGEWEVRLRIQPDSACWHADVFGAGWRTSPYDAVPPEYRAEVAAYVDQSRALSKGLVQESALRQAAAEGGGPAVDRLVHSEFDRLDQWFTALDQLHTALQGPAEEPPSWAYDLVRDELQELNTAREWLLSATAEYSWGRSGPRPDTLFAGLRYVFSTGWVDLMRSSQPGPAARSFFGLVDDTYDTRGNKLPDTPRP
ncbi:hypothetical protein [Streptomyces sp. NPDC053048]|uniref:hypothetical protein n=1 Tax=Streptomyces sp. NPDC053048 TaxID=3365694 RepID=UPI0037D50875